MHGLKLSTTKLATTPVKLDHPTSKLSIANYSENGPEAKTLEAPYKT